MRPYKHLIPEAFAQSKACLNKDRTMMMSEGRVKISIEGNNVNTVINMID